VSKTFRQEGQDVRALDDVSLQVTTGQTLGLVGESGSGKTTLAKVLLGLTEPEDGSVVELTGKVLAPEVHRRDDDQVRNLQIVFQNPDQALNRRWPARRIIGRAVQRLTGKRGAARDAEVLKLAEQMRFDRSLLSARPAQLSGGLKQRVAIARAFVGPPQVVVCDEPTSALDVSVQAAILNLLADLQARDHTTYLFISHDLGVVRFIADRIAVLYLGRVMEVGAADDVFAGPHHPYTEALLSAVSTVDESPSDRVRLQGEIPSAASPPAGCVFHTRCPRRIGEVCDTERPPLLEVASGHSMACHIPYDELAAAQRRSSAERP
jgi:peptide/nickel transport system ATP-binding protein